MALSKQPPIATDPITRTPDDMPSAKASAGIKPLAARPKPIQPVTVNRLPTTIVRRLMYFLTVFISHETGVRNRRAWRETTPAFADVVLFSAVKRCATELQVEFLLRQHYSVADVNHAVVGNDVDSSDVGAVNFDPAYGGHGQRRALDRLDRTGPDVLGHHRA